MKIYFIIFFIVLSSLGLVAQDKLIIKYEHVAYLYNPLRLTTDSIIFQKKGKKYITQTYIHNKKEEKFKTRKKISKRYIEGFLYSNTPLKLKNLGITLEEIKQACQRHKVQLLPSTLAMLKDDFVFRFDTLAFCQKHLMVINKFSVTDVATVVEVYHNNQQTFRCGDSSYNNTNFSIEKFLRVYSIVKSAELDDLDISNFLNKEQCLKWLVEYFDTIQCEDYYYRLYLKDNPPKDDIAKRKRVGWNFEEYLKKIKNTK